MQQGVEVSVSYHVRGDRLHVAYGVVNRRQQDIYLVDFAVGVGRDGPYLREDYMIASYQSPDTAVLSCILLPLPAYTQWVTPPTVYARKVVAGTTYQNTASIPLPLRDGGAAPRRGLEGAAMAEREEVVICSKLRFEIGYIPHGPDLTPTILELLGMEIHVLSMAAWKHHFVATVETIGEDIPVIVGKDSVSN